MSRRRTGEIVGSVILSFLEEGTWTQAALSRRAGTSTETIKRILEDLNAGGWPLERQVDPPHVYWSLPRGWLPGGVLVPLEEVEQLLRMLARLPETPERNRLISRLRPLPTIPSPSLQAWVHRPHRPLQEQHLRRIEDAIRDREALRVRYLSIYRGIVDDRAVSFQRIQQHAEVRLCGHCHRSGTLKWFRLDRVMEIDGPADTPFVAHEEDELDGFVESTIDGFQSDADRGTTVFFVPDPTARWLRLNLPDPMRAESVEGGIRVTADNVSVSQVARYVMSLGGEARPESPELVQAVRCLVERLGHLLAASP